MLRILSDSELTEEVLQSTRRVHARSGVDPSCGETPQNCGERKRRHRRLLGVSNAWLFLMGGGSICQFILHHCEIVYDKIKRSPGHISVARPGLFPRCDCMPICV